MFARRLEDLAGTDKDMVRRDGDKVLHARRLLTKGRRLRLLPLRRAIIGRIPPSTCTIRTTWKAI